MATDFRVPNYPDKNNKGYYKSKYQFSEHLTREGDWVETPPLSRIEVHRLENAAVVWARYHGYVVGFERLFFADKGTALRITLKQKYRTET